MSGAPLKQPPHSIEAEQAVLGGLMLDNGAWERIDGTLSAGDFYRHDHRLIFEAIDTLAGRGEPFDLVTLTEHLKDTGNERDVGGMAYLGQLASQTPSAANIEAYARIVAERARRRDLMVLHESHRNAAWNTDGRSLGELLGDAESELLRVRDECANASAGPRRINGVLTRTVELLEELHERKTPVAGLATGFTDLDALTTGLYPGNLIVLGARPSMGKSAIASGIAEHVAIEGTSVLMFSLEMSEEEMALRTVSSIGRIPLQRLRSGRLEDDDWPRLTHAVTKLSEAKLFIDERPALTVAEIRATARRLQKTEGLGLVVVDYLGLMAGEGETQTLKVGALASGCKAIAKELKVPVILLAQLNRGLETRPDKRPIMADLRDSGEIEQAADLIWFLYRDEVYNPESPDQGTAELIVAKQRNGPRGTVRLTFRGECVRFENYHPDVYGVGSSLRGSESP